MEICKKEVKFANKVVLVRVDYNVPLEKSEDSFAWNSSPLIPDTDDIPF